MQSLRNLIYSNISILSPTYRSLSAIGALTMLGASIGAVYSPVAMSANLGLPLAPASSTEPVATAKTGSSASQSRVLNKHSPGYLIVFAGRNSVLALSMLALNYMGELRALSVIGQLMTLGGLADSLATYWYGTEGSYKGHLIPTLTMAWMGPLGLLMYY